MGLIQTVPPSQEPMTLEEVKLQLRIDGSDLDSEVSSHIKAAREYAEAVQNKAFLAQTWEQTFDTFPKMPVNLPLWPVQKVEFIKIFDDSGNEIVMEPTGYILDQYSIPGRIFFKNNVSWPNVKLKPVNGIIISFTCGFISPELVPDNIKAAMMLHIKLLSEDYDSKEREQMEKARDNLLNIGRLWPI